MLISTIDLHAQVGARAIACNPSGGSGGLAAGTYDTTLLGRPALIIVSENYDPATPTLLSFYLHGDGGGYQFYAGEGRALNQFVRDQGWIYVSVQSNLDPESGITRWWGSGVSSNEAGNAGIEENAQLLENVFEDMFAKYNLCKNILLGHSASGGSWFYDGYFVPTRGDRYPAFMNLNCGSSGIDPNWSFFPFYDNLLTFNQDAAIQNRTQMHYTVGTTDFLYDEAQDAVPHYQGLGFNVTTDYLDMVGHCDFSISDKTIAYWQAVDQSVEILIGQDPTPTPTVIPEPSVTPGPSPTPPVLDKFVYLPLQSRE